MPPTPRARVAALALALLAAAGQFVGGPVEAQALAPPTPLRAIQAPAGAAAPDAQPTADAGLPTGAELDALVRVLEDPAGREDLLARLRALRAVGTAAAPAPTPTPPPSAPQELADAISDAVDRRLDAVVEGGRAAVSALAELPNLAEWLRLQATNDFRRQFWDRVLWGVGAMVGAGLLAGMLLALAVRGPVRRLVPAPGASLARRVGVRAAAFLLDLAPTAGFVAAAALVLRVHPLPTLTATVGGYAVLAVVLQRMLAKLTRHALDAREPERRWLALPDGMERPLARWTRAIGTTAICGYFGLRAADRLGLPPRLLDVLSHILFATVAAATTVGLLRARMAIEGFVRRTANVARERALLRAVVPWDALASWASAGAIGLVWAHYLVWAVGQPGGFAYLFVGTSVTFAAIAGAQLALLGLRGLEHRWRPPPPRAEEGGQEPAEQPANRAAGGAVLFASGRVVVRALALVAVLQGWGIDLAGWLRSPAGSGVLEDGLRVLVILGAALLFWLTIDRWIGRYIAAKDTAGNLLHSNRSRTLANIARNVFLVLGALFAGAAVLAALGVDTGPLLAGAGVVGLAVGFGSQALVKDVITGLFILLGDTMRVGDIVSIAGKGGVVEALSMRAVALRDYDGGVHTIPYGSIDVVTNLTKDFSYWVFRVAVGYREDVDQVVECLREIDEKIRKEWPYRRIILEPLEIAGVDQFAESAAVLLARIKTRPADQWRVGREMQRRIMIEFDKRGIEVPYPYRTVQLAYGRPGGLPPPVVEQLRRDVEERGRFPAAMDTQRRASGA